MAIMGNVHGQVVEIILDALNVVNVLLLERSRMEHTNMSDLISREALLEVVYNNVVPDKNGNWTFTKPIIDAIANKPAIEQDEIVKKAVADALEEAAKISDEVLGVNNISQRIRALIKRNAEGVE